MSTERGRGLTERERGLLLVGDGSVAAASTWRALAGNGFRVLMTTTLREALEMLTHNEVAGVVVLGDNRTRNCALLDRLRSELDGSGGRTLVVLTTVDSADFDGAMRDHGADECLRHGALRGDQLARVLHGLVDCRQARHGATALGETLKASNRRLSRLRSKRQSYVDDLLAAVRGPASDILTQVELLLRDLRGPLTHPQRECVLALRETGQQLASMAEQAVVDEARHGRARTSDAAE